LLFIFIRKESGISLRSTCLFAATSTIVKLRIYLKIRVISFLIETNPFAHIVRNIRDDKGCWSKIEAYIHKHSGTEFSHGICPECAKKYYPAFNLYDE
jgi:hypothetical protein